MIGHSHLSSIEECRKYATSFSILLVTPAGYKTSWNLDEAGSLTAPVAECGYMRRMIPLGGELIGCRFRHTSVAMQGRYILATFSPPPFFPSKAHDIQDC